MEHPAMLPLLLTAMLCMVPCECADQASEVHELKGMPSGAETSFDEGADIHNPTSLFPGPKYGLPGYKESHKWVGSKEFDMFSPLIFDEGWYQRAYADLDGKTVGEVRKDWADHLTNEDNGYPTGCRQGNPIFSPNKYFRANPNIKESLKLNANSQETCLSIYQDYMTQNIFEGVPTYNREAEEAEFKRGDEGKQQIESEFYEEPINKGVDKTWSLAYNTASLGTDVMSAAEQYTLTFWYRPSRRKIEPESSILHRGNTFAEKTPQISQVGGGRNMLKFLVAFTNNDALACTPSEILDLKWNFISLTVEKHKIKVSYNGDEVCSKDNPGGTPKILNERELYAPSPFQAPSFGKLQGIKYYPMQSLSDNLLEYSMQKQQEELK